jgi:tripartite ATP-independent transporter DctM subunit
MRGAPSVENSLIYLLIPFAVFLFIGVPIAFSLGLASAVYVFFSGRPVPFSMIITETVAGVDNYALLALPAFMMTGELLNRCGMTEHLIRLATSVVGWIRGGLAHVTVVTGMLLACISGSAIADSATLGPLMIPAMVKERYPAPFAASIAASAAVIGGILPPSVPLVIVGSQLGISIGGLFLAGVIPGLVTGVLLMLTSWVIARRRNYGVVHEFAGAQATLKNAALATPTLMAPVIIVGGILGGVFTPAEAGAVAVLYSILLGFLYYRRLNGVELRGAMLATARITAAALIIVGTSLVFGRLLTYEQVPQKLLELLLAVTDNRIVLITILIVFFLFVGTFMDSVAGMIILGPLLLPLATQALGMSQFQYGLFLMYALLLGILTPPLAPVLTIMAPIAKISIERLSIAIMPFFCVMVFVLFLIAFVPEMTTWLPRVAGYQ